MVWNHTCNFKSNSILKSRIWFQTKLHSTQFNYHYILNNSWMRLSNHLAPVVQKLDSTIQWISIRETSCIIHWMEIYPVHSATQLLNNWSRENYGDWGGCYLQRSYSSPTWKKKEFLTVPSTIKACILTYIILWFYTTTSLYFVRLFCNISIKPLSMHLYWIQRESCADSNFNYFI